jgi:serine/threonine protein kinase
MLANNDGVQKSKSFKGTPYWMSPELVRMEGHSYPADIWSVGCVVLEMLTTLPPYTTLTRNVREVLKKIANGGKNFNLKQYKTYYFYRDTSLS